MQYALDETSRRREKQIAYNTAPGADPQPLRKNITDILDHGYRPPMPSTSSGNHWPRPDANWRHRAVGLPS